MTGDLTRNWWAVVLRGVVAIIFGLFALFLPGITLTALVLLFGAYALVDGVFAIVSAIRGQAGRSWWELAIEGIAGIAAGVIALVWPGITALALLFVIAAWAIVTGVLEVVAAIRLRQRIEREWLLALAGIASILFGVVLIIAPVPGALAVLWLIGIYAILFGALLVALGLKLRSLGRAERQQPPGEARRPAA